MIFGLLLLGGGGYYAYENPEEVKKLTGGLLGELDLLDLLSVINEFKIIMRLQLVSDSERS